MDEWYRTLQAQGRLVALEAIEEALNVQWPLLLLAILAPLLIIYCRNESRIRRLKLIQDFIEAFPSSDDDTSGHQRGRQDAQDPSLEFIKSKYMADARIPQPMSDDFRSASDAERIQIIIRATRAFGNPGDFQLFASSLGFMVLSYYGFLFLFNALEQGLATTSGETSGACSPRIMIQQLEIIGSLAFAGAYVAAVRVFMRGVAVFDLSAYTFMKQTIEMMASIVLIIFAFRAFPDPLEAIGAAVTVGNTTTTCAEIPWYWWAIAPSLALLPESSSNFILARVQNVIRWVKRDDDRFVDATRVIPLNVIEGIDYFTRFRLEQCGIQEVQNLATYNPIQLFVESPFGIYQCVDWVGQAQLCHIVGIDRFLLLREMHVRTVFDLERAIDFSSRRQGDGSLQESPPEFDRIFAGILFATTDVMRSVEKAGKLRPFHEEEGKLVAGSIEDYCEWALSILMKDQKTTKVCIEHLMAWISDDLHVRRLRRIWQEMGDSLGARAERLDNPKRLTSCSKCCEISPEQQSEPEPDAPLPTKEEVKPGSPDSPSVS